MTSTYQSKTGTSPYSSKNLYGNSYGSSLRLNGSDFFINRPRETATSSAGLTASPSAQLSYRKGTEQESQEPLKPVVSGAGGTEGLISGIFGKERVITQKYGNVNPIEPTKGNINYGTDIRTRDLAGAERNITLPVQAKVLDIKYDDGTRFGSRSGHQGYGNSVLVELPSGERLRFSHLDNFGKVAIGQTLNPGDAIGTPGTSGNTYGEHLDLEYYNRDGKIDSPDNFSGFSNQPQMPASATQMMPKGGMQPLNNGQGITPPAASMTSRSMGQKIPSPSMYTVRSGDTLWGIAQRNLGSGARWKELGYQGDPRKLQVGTQLNIRK